MNERETVVVRVDVRVEHMSEVSYSEIEHLIRSTVATWGTIKVRAVEVEGIVVAPIGPIDCDSDYGCHSDE